MKTTSLLLLASLLANVALVAFIATRPRPTGPAPASPVPAPVAGAATGSSSARDAALRAALVSGSTVDLEAAGLDPTLAREIALGRTLTRIATRPSTEKTGAGDGRWWRNSGNNPASREQQLQWRREMTDALVAAGLDPSFLQGPGDPGQLAFLPAAKREALRRITQDYDEMMAKFSAGGVQLASDRERLKLLRAEKERDIAALLTPDERLAYEMRTSNSAAVVRARYGDGIQSEEDYRKVYDLQKAFDDKFSLDTLNARTNPEGMRAFSAAQRQLQEDIRAALGEASYAQLRRATDPDLRTVDSLVTRLNLPPATTDRVAAARETFATESQRINADASVAQPQRRTQIQELANRAKAEVQQLLGNEAADAYAQRSTWLNLLQNGLAYSTAPQPGSPGASLAGAVNQSVFPVMPAGTGAAGSTRQMIVTGANAVTTDAAGHGGVFIGTPGGVVRDNVQVMTFTTTSDASVPAVVGERTIIMATPPANPPVAPVPTTTPPR